MTSSDFWDRLAALHVRCHVSVISAYPSDERGNTGIRWIVKICPLGLADAAEYVESRNPSVLVAMQEAMDQARAKGWTG